MEEEKFRGHMAKKKPGQKFELDIKDRKILFELSINARYSAARIAKLVGLSRDTVEYRINNLIKNSIISGFITIIDLEKTGVATAHLVYLKLQKFNKEFEEMLIEFLVNHKNTIWVCSCIGKWDIGISAVSRKGMSQFNETLSEILSFCGEHLQEHLVLGGVEESYLPQYHLIENLKDAKKLDTYSDYSEKEDGSFQRQLIESRKKESKEAAKLDETDFKILQILFSNARIRVLDLAKKVNLSAHAVTHRIERLIREHVITGFMPLISLHLLGLEWHMTFIKFQNLAKQKEKEFKTYLLYHPYILWYVKFAGQWDMQLSIFVKDSAHFKSIMDELLSNFNDVIRSYESIMIYNQHKFMYKLE